jgi:hypothetical protein
MELSNKQGFLLINGSDPNRCTIHSEPPKKEDRMFLSILTGTESEMKRRYGDVIKHQPDISAVGKYLEQF